MKFNWLYFNLHNILSIPGIPNYSIISDKTTIACVNGHYHDRQTPDIYFGQCPLSTDEHYVGTVCCGINVFYDLVIYCYLIEGNSAILLES
jgi:hypothetical protein